jgi:Domain of unknown function (DUF4331)
VYRSTGAAARGTGPIGEVVIASAPVSVGGEVQVVAAGGYRFLSGLRSDPFFLDADGLRNGFQFTGHDTFADRNVFGMVLEVPNTALGSAASLRLWARTVAPVYGNVAQVDLAGRPGIATVFNRTDADRAAFNEAPPTDQRERFGARFVAALQTMGYSEGQADDLMRSFLPDVLEYDPSDPGGYPNGRRLSDDVVDLMSAMVTMGRVATDGVGPHTDLLDEFPYLGAPHAIPV